MADQGEIDAQRKFARRFGENLVHARRAAGLSQEALSFEAGLHRTEIGALERGIRIPRLDTLVKLAAVLGISVQRLIAGIEWEAPQRGGGSFSVTSRENK